MSVSESANCGVCSKVVSYNDNGLMCEICDRWFHSKCQDICDTLYKQICKKDNIHQGIVGFVTWVAKSC